MLNRNEASAEKRFFALKAASTLCIQLADLEKVQIPGLRKRVGQLEEEIEKEREGVEETDDKLEVGSSYVDFSDII